MSLINDNDVLASAEKEIENGLTPETRADYMKIVTAGMRVALHNGPDGFAARLRHSKTPIADCATGAISLVMMMRAQAKGNMSMKAMIPAAASLMLQGLDFLGKSGVVKVGADELGQAMHVFTNRLFQVLRITMPMLNKAAAQVHQVMNDPTKMELIQRKVGMVKDPRASTPTVVAESEGVP